MPTYRLSDIAARLGARLEPAPAVTGAADPEISGVSGIREALPGQLSFLAGHRYQAYVAETRATALIVGPEFKAADINGSGPRFYLRVDNAYFGFMQALRLFGGDRVARPVGVHPTAILAEDVVRGADISIGAQVVIEAGARLGDRVVVMPGCFIGAGTEIGADAVLWPNVTVREGVTIGCRVILHPGAVIGSDGFGFVQEGGSHHKIPQLGTVVIEDDVEIGANSTVDRATTGVTRVAAGVKIDNLVQVGHNVTIGPHSLICAQVGVSGSTQIGRHVVLAGQAGLGGHLTIGDNAVVGGQAGVTKSVPANTRVSGYPAMDHESALRVEAHTRRLPELARELKALRSRLTQLELELEKDRERVL